MSKYSCSSRGVCEVDERGEYTSGEECLAACSGWENRDVTLLAYQYDLEAALRDLSPSDLADLFYIITGKRVGVDIAYEELEKYRLNLPFTYSYIIRGDDPIFFPYEDDWPSGFSEVMLFSPNQDYLLVPDGDNYVKLQGDVIYIGELDQWGRRVRALYPPDTIYVMTTASHDINGTVERGQAIPLTVAQALAEVAKARSAGKHVTSDYFFSQREGAKEWEYIKTLPIV